MDILASLDFIVSILVGLILITILVAVHELGHAIAARRNGVVVEEFGIGFPPRAWSKKLKNGILFSLNWLPIGGFVKLQGENDSADQPGDYGAASFWVKTKILLAGVAINWLTAVLIFTVLAFVGLPKIIPDQFSVPGDTTEVSGPVTAATVTADSPAARAGLQSRDEIVSVAGSPIEESEDLFEATETNKGETVEVAYIRDGEQRSTTVELNPDRSSGGYLGVVPFQVATVRATWSAPIVGVATTAQLSGVVLQELGNVVVKLFNGVLAQFSSDGEVREEGGRQIGELSQNIAGPLGLILVIFPTAQDAGIVILLTITAIISLTLAIMNTLPIPALDGGRFFLTALFRVLRKPLTKEREEKINATGFILLMGLLLLATISDVSKLL